MTHKKLLWILPLMMLLLLSIAYAVGTAPNSSDSIAYYPLEDLTDSTKLYNLTLSGDTNLVAGILNNSYAFDGTDDYLKATGFSSDSTYSISVWGRPDDYADADQWIVSGGDGSGTYPDIYFGIDKRIRFGGDQADTRIKSDVNYTTGTWYHIVGVADGKDRYLYINGILVNTTLAQPADATFNSDIRIGERGNGIGDFNGTIDEVAFFNKSLNSSEVTYLFNSGSPSSDQQYPFIETILTNFTVTANNTWDDSSINSFNISYDRFGITYEYNTTTGSITAPFDNYYNINDDNWTSRYTLNNSVLDSWGSNDGTVSGTTLNDGTVNGATLTTDKNGRANSAYSFDGELDHIKVDNDSSLNPADDYSISMWVYNRAGTDLTPTLFNRAQQSDANGYWWVYTNGTDEANIKFQYSDSVTSTSKTVTWTSVLDKDAWNHLVFVYSLSAETISLYADDVFISARSIPNARAVTSGDLYFGDYRGVHTNHTFYGYMDDIQFFNKGLTSTEITELYTNSTFYNALNGDGLIAYYNFNGNANDTHNYVTGKDGGDSASYNFDGVGDIITITPYDVNGSSTLCTTIKPTDFSTYPHLFSWTGSGTDFIRINNDGLKVNMETSTNGDLVNLPYTFILNELYNICFTLDSTLWSMYINGEFVNNATVTDTHLIINRFGGTGVSKQFKGSMQDIMIFDRALSPTEITTIYENGITYNELANITISATDYFPRTYTDYNMTTDLEAGLHQSSIGFTTQELISEDYLTGVTYVIEGMTNTTFQLNTGIYNVTSIKTGYYNLTTLINITPLQSTIIALTGMYDSILNITLTSHPTGNINNFTINTNHYNETTTNGYVELPTLQNYSNNIDITNITSDNYTSRLNQLYTTTAILNTTNYIMYPFNSIRILIYNGTTNNLITSQNVTINTISSVTNFENTTSDGNITISFLSPISYELRFESEDFTTTSYFITITDDTSTEISIYMTINTSETDIQRVKVINGGNNPIEDAIIWLQKENYGTFTTINQRVSGNDGLVSFYVNKDIDKYYRFIVIYEDEVKLTTTKTVFVPDIDDIIELEIDTETTSVNDIFSDVLGLNTTVWFTGDNDEIVNYQFIDASNKISGARLLITSTNLTDDTITVRFNTSKNGVSGIYTVSLNNTPTTLLNDTIYTIKAYITYDARDELLVYETTKTFGLSVILDRNTGLLYAVIILLFTALLTATTMKPLLSGIISLAILIPLTMIKLISVPIGIIAGFIVFFIIVFIKIRSGGNQ